MAPNADFQAAVLQCQHELSTMLKSEGDEELSSIIRPTTNAKPKKNVSFVSSCSVYRVPHIADMPTEVIRSIWWSADDFGEFKRDIGDSLALLEASSQEGQSSSVLETKDSTARGLEHHTPQYLEKRRRRRESAYAAVLVEQEMQWQEGSYDPDYIAEVYSEISSKSQAEAGTQGLKDQKEVLKMQSRQKRRSSRRSSYSSSSSSGPQAAGGSTSSPQPKHQRRSSKRATSVRSLSSKTKEADTQPLVHC